MLYFFHGRTADVVSHSRVKEAHVAPKEIDKAIDGRENLKKAPKAHTYEKSDYSEKQKNDLGCGCDFASPILPGGTLRISELAEARAEDELARKIYELREQED